MPTSMISNVPDYYRWLKWVASLNKDAVFAADFHRCNKALSAKEQDTAPCVWYQRVYKSLCPISWVSSSDCTFQLKTNKGGKNNKLGAKTWRCFVELNLVTYQLFGADSGSEHRAADRIKRGLCLLTSDLIISSSPPQVQKWDEQLESGSFPGKIWTVTLVSIHWTFLLPCN